MTEILWTLATLLGHWRRRSLALAMLLLGLAMATALWSGVQALNAQARESYDRAAALFGAGAPPSLVSTAGGLFPQQVWADMRRAGAKVSPVLEGSLLLAGGGSVRLVGIEPLSAPHGSRFGRVADAGALASFLDPPGRAVVAPETRAELGAAEGARLSSADGALLPPLETRADALPGAVFVDIGVAQTLLGRPGRLSRLLLDGPVPQGLLFARSFDGKAASGFPENAPGGALRLEQPDEENDVARLTDSLHLNLTAFGMLAFLVGLFLVYAAFGDAFQQRLPMLRVFLCIGVSRRAIVAALAIEALTLALLAGLVGMVCGYFLAAALLPDVAASLEGLYGARVAGRLTLDASWWAAGLGMACAGGLAAAASGAAKIFRLPAIATARQIAWREAERASLRRQTIGAGAAFVAAFVASCFGSGLASGFLATAGVLLGAALLAPPALSAALRFFEARAEGVMTRWFWAESRAQLPSLSLALMALLLALATSVGVGGMVESFRGAFLQWLDSRLVAEVYVEAASDEAGRRIEEWLRSTRDVDAILPVAKAKTRLANWPVEIVGARAHETYEKHFPLQAAAPDAWGTLRRGDGVLVSEQLARRLGRGLGDEIEIAAPAGVWRPRIAGVFPDYGNARGQLRVDLDVLTRLWPEAPRTGFALRLAPTAARGLVSALRERFGPDIARVMDQAAVKKLSTGVFEKTFAVTAALDALTLCVSCIAFLASLLMLSERRLAQLAPLWAIGIARETLLRLEALRILLFAGATALAAIPLGVALEWLLVSLVNVRAFGWRLPLELFPGEWARMFAFALLAGAVAALAPVLRLARATPAELTKVFTNER